MNATYFAINPEQAASSWALWAGLLTLAPSLLKLRTIPAPMPRAPPVTMATLPCNDILIKYLQVNLSTLLFLAVCISIVSLEVVLPDVMLWTCVSRGVLAVGAISAPEEEGTLKGDLEALWMLKKRTRDGTKRNEYFSFYFHTGSEFFVLGLECSRLVYTLSQYLVMPV